MNNQQAYNTTPSLSGFEKIIKIISIVLIVYSSLVILFYLLGYFGIVIAKIESSLWVCWSFINVIFMLFKPVILIVTITCAGFMFYRILIKRENRKVTVILAIATGMSLLALLTNFVVDKKFVLLGKRLAESIVIEQNDWTGESLPDFTFENINKGLPPITIEDLQGKPSVLVFWSIHDTPWSSNYKYSQDLYNHREKLNINVFAIAVDKSKEDITKFLEKHPGSMPVFHDPGSNYKHSLNLMGSVEKVIIVDSNTTIQKILGAPESLDEIKTALNKIQ